MINKKFTFIDKATGKVWIELAPTFNVAKLSIFKNLKIKSKTFVTKTRGGDYLIER